MFVYEKKLQYPVKIKNPNPAFAKIIITQFGGLNFNRYKMKNNTTYLAVWYPNCTR